MSTKKNKSVIFAILMVLVIAFCISCSHKDDNSKNSPTKGVNDPAQVVDSDNKGSKDEVTPKAQNPDSDDKNQAGDASGSVTPKPTGADDASGQDDTENPDDKAKEDGSEDTDAQKSLNPDFAEDTASREEIWELTFLKWLPLYMSGRYVGNEAADTFDYALFTNASKDKVLEYIKELQQKGFNSDVEMNELGDAVDYTASNKDKWSVSINYSEGTLKIGSGYFEEKKETLDTVFSDTLLSNLPAFESGTKESHGQDNNGADYVIFSGVSESNVREYIESVKSLGFKLDSDEGDSDGIIWFYGVNADDFYCDITYYDAVIKITCGKG